MKKNYSRILFATPLLALALAASANAGTTTETIKEAPAPEKMISATLSLDLNTHFVSYGNDVWNDGSSMSEPTFNPSFELAVKLPADFTWTLGTWWDVNSKAGGNSSPLGGRIQEVDVWTGLAYSIGDFTIKTAYQAWMYNGETEDILDVTLSYNTFLSPSITIHNRLDAGGAGIEGNTPGSGEEGTVIVGALSYSFEAGPVTIAIPFNLAYFVDDDFHAAGADNGIGYGSLGVTATLPLSFIGEEYGAWSIHGGLTYYVTDQEVIPDKAKGDFLTANLGLTVAF